MKKYIETYRGVKLYHDETNVYPYSGRGILWSSKSVETLKRYIDNTIDSGNKAPNKQGELVRV